jgi:serine/threonine-protein kinase/endoribonuclease IRE1
MDVFSLGCIIHYCITGGRHPFGEQYERDGNIMRGRPDLQHLQVGRLMSQGSGLA